MATKEELFARPVVNSKYQGTLGNISPIFNKAIKKAEGNPRNFGVLSEEVNSPDEANSVLNKSIDNNFWRWILTSKDNKLPQEKFVDFMQQRWAPVGAENDPKNLNKNWVSNVRKAILEQIGNEQYKKWQLLNLVLRQQKNKEAV